MKLLGRGGLGCLFGVVLGALAPSAARADLIFVTNAGSNTIGEYTTAGATVNAALVTGLSSPVGIALAGAYFACLFRSTRGKVEARTEGYGSH